MTTARSLFCLAFALLPLTGEACGYISFDRFPPEAIIKDATAIYFGKVDAVSVDDPRQSSRTVSILETLLGSPKEVVVVSSVTLGNCGPSPYLPNIGEYAIVAQDKSGHVGIQKIDLRSEFAGKLRATARSVQSTGGAQSASTVELGGSSPERGRELKSRRTDAFDEAKDMSFALMDALIGGGVNEQTRRLSAVLHQLVTNPEQFACYLVEGDQDSLQFGILYLTASAKKKGIASDEKQFANELLGQIADYLRSYSRYSLNTTRTFVDNQIVSMQKGVNLQALGFVTGVESGDKAAGGTRRILQLCKPLQS